MTSVAAANRARVNMPRQKRTLRGRIVVRALFALSAVLTRLPDAPLHRAADALGGVLYRAQPRRRGLVRANLQRVASYLVDNNMANEATAAAARDATALDRLTRAAFGHYVRSYLEGATLGRYGTAAALARVVPDDPSAADVAFPLGRRGPTIVIGLHFGAVEIPALWATSRGVPLTAPMETVADPDLQSYFERSRGQTGLNVIPLRGAAANVRGVLRRGETVVLVADRPLSGNGLPVDLFGAPARLPVGPAILAIETRSPAWVVATRRSGRDYRTRLERVDVPVAGRPRERVALFMDGQTRAFERAIADAPEQWWTVFFPIWDDLGEAS